MPRKKKEAPNRSDGLYEVKVTVGKSLNGALIRKSFYSKLSKADAKKQADDYKIEMEVANRTGVGFVKKNKTLGEWSTQWLETYKKPDVSESTYKKTYCDTVVRYILPYFGNAVLTDITPLDIKRFYALKKTYSDSILHKMQLCFNGIFETAIENDLCYKNPAKNVSYNSVADKAVKLVYTEDEICRVEEIAEYCLPEVLILLETGLRRGELCGLMWSDIDLNAMTISVNRSIAHKIGGGIEIHPPKWNSYRTNPLSLRAAQILRNLPMSSEYVFPNRFNSVQQPSSLSDKLDRFMNNLVEDIPRLTAHELRHTYGTSLRRRGVDIYTIQKIMGHRDINVTTEIYVHNEIGSLKKALKNCI